MGHYERVVIDKEIQSVSKLYQKHLKYYKMGLKYNLDRWGKEVVEKLF